MAGNGQNQWTKRAKLKSPEVQRKLIAWRERFKAEELIDRLVKHSRGGLELGATQIKAIELVLDRLEPRLSAVEQTLIDPDLTKTEAELIQEAIALFKAHPELLRQAGFVPIAPQDAAKPLNTGTSD